MMRNLLIWRSYRRSFQIRLFVAITGLAILFISATGYFAYLLGRQSLEKQIEQYAVGTAEQIADRVRTYLQQPARAVRQLKAAIESGFVDPSDEGGLIRFFHLLQQDYPEFLNINYGSRDGRFTMVPPQRPEVHKIFDPRIRPWYRGAVDEQGLYWTQVYVFASSQHPGITVSAPIVNASRSLAGVCAIDIDLSTFSRFLNTLRIGGKGYAYIIDNAQGRVIAHPQLLNPHFQTDLIRVLNAGLQRLKEGRRQFDRSVLDGQAFFTACTDYPENNWSVGVNLPVSDFLASINAIKKATATLVIVAVCISCVVSYLVALTVVKPLRSLEQGIQRVSAGDLDHKVRLDRLHIVSNLAEAFNQMAASLQQSREELKKTYFALAEKEKMAALGQLTAGIAHEIKNPLGIILGAAQVAANPRKPEAMRGRATQFIIDEVIRLNQTLQSFLAFARPVPPRLVPTNIMPLLEELLAGMAATCNRQSIQVATVVAGTPFTLMVDPDQMRQVLLNLLLNAVQAMPRGGRLTVRCSPKPAMVGAAPPNRPTPPGKPPLAADVLTIAISDTGEGIVPDRLGKIFEPFATFKDGGTGLGLSIVAQILKMHHADIEVESTPGRGSTFTILLPLTEVDNHAA